MKNIMRKNGKIKNSIIIIAEIGIIIGILIYTFLGNTIKQYTTSIGNAKLETEDTEEDTDYCVWVEENYGFRENYDALGEQQVGVGGLHFLVENIIPSSLNEEFEKNEMYYGNDQNFNTNQFQKYDYATNSAYGEGITVIFQKYVNKEKLEEDYKELYEGLNPKGKEIENYYEDKQDSKNEYIGINNTIIAKEGNYIIQMTVTEKEKWNNGKALFQAIIKAIEQEE